MSIFLLIVAFAFSGLGYLCLVSRRQNDRFDITALLAAGFSISWFGFCVLYLGVVWAGHESLRLLVILASVQTVVGIVLLVFFGTPLLKRLPGAGFAELASLLALFVFAIVLPQAFLGNLPVYVSDSWSHISIINRFIDTGSVSLTSFSMPGDRYVLRYSPHHAFLAVVARVSGATALDVFVAARFFYPMALTSAFLFFARTLDAQRFSGVLAVCAAGLVFILTFVTTDGVWRGAADYRAPAFILMLFGSGLIFRFYHENDGLRLGAAILGLAFAIGVTHAIEIAILAVMWLPYGAWLYWRTRAPSTVGKVAFLFVSFAVSGLAGYLLASVAFVPLNRAMSYWGFVQYYRAQLGVHIVQYTWVVAVLAVVALLLTPRSVDPASRRVDVSLFLAISLASSLLLGALNPVLYPIYNVLMGGSHANRMMYAFPYYLALAYGLALSVRCARNPSGTVRLIALCGIAAVISAVAVHFYIKSGMDGSISYRRDDSISQLRLYPRFYELIRTTYSRRIIVSDPFTSAPINAVSNNYVFTHRPWTGGVGDRYLKARDVMKNPIGALSREIICSFRIDVLAINRSVPPRDIEEVWKQASWSKSDFDTMLSTNDIQRANGFKLVGSPDDIDVFEIDRGVLCEDPT